MNRIIPVLVLLAALPAVAQTGIPDLSHCYWIHDLTEAAGACTCPAGDGDPLSAMRRGAAVVDGTITVHMLDMNDQPIVNYPAEDLWLEGLGMGFCLPPPSADGPTDAQGITTFTLSPGFRGVQTGPLLVAIGGDVMADAGGALFRFASVDLDGSGYVNLSDVILFANRYRTGEYDPAVDFYFDGRLSLSDVVVLAEHLDHQCP